MFLMMGVTQDRRDFDFHQMTVCPGCGSYGRYQVFMTYMLLSLFFIPVFKWGRKYYVQTSCCQAVYALDPEIGRHIAAGEHVTIENRHLTLVQKGFRSHIRQCRRCGYSTQEDFTFCPKCGEPF